MNWAPWRVDPEYSLCRPFSRLHADHPVEGPGLEDGQIRGVERREDDRQARGQRQHDGPDRDRDRVAGRQEQPGDGRDDGQVAGGHDEDEDGRGDEIRDQPHHEVSDEGTGPGRDGLGSRIREDREGDQARDEEDRIFVDGCEDGWSDEGDERRRQHAAGRDDQVEACQVRGFRPVRGEPAVDRDGDDQEADELDEQDRGDRPDRTSDPRDPEQARRGRDEEVAPGGRGAVRGSRTRSRS